MFLHICVVPVVSSYVKVKMRELEDYLVLTLKPELINRKLLMLINIPL